LQILTEQADNNVYALTSKSVWEQIKSQGINCKLYSKPLKACDASFDYEIKKGNSSKFIIAGKKMDQISMHLKQLIIQN